MKLEDRILENWRKNWKNNHHGNYDIIRIAIAETLKEVEAIVYEMAGDYGLDIPTKMLRERIKALGGKL
jgi:hypothetical protein